MELVHEPTGPIDADDCTGEPGEITVEGAKVTFVPSETYDGREVDEYEVVGTFQGSHVVAYLGNGGGASYFSGVLVIENNGQLLRRVATLAGGDRCNGGVTGAQVLPDGSGVEFSVSVTPTDIVRLGHAGESVEAELEEYPHSCFANATYQWTGGVVEFRHLELNAEAITHPADWTDSFAHQPCFNASMEEALEAGPRLELTGLEAFVARFRARCIQP